MHPKVEPEEIWERQSVENSESPRTTDYEFENSFLRELLWLKHGCTDLYGDDGERQCLKCRLDFKRDDVLDIAEKLTENGLRILSESGILDDLANMQGD